MGTISEQARLSDVWVRIPRQRGMGKTVSHLASNLWHKYRVTIEQYNTVRGQQDYRCAICGVHESDLPSQGVGRPRADGTRAVARLLGVDHDHACCPTSAKSCGNCNRELLCGNCNRGLGLFGDSPERLRDAAAYVEKWRKLHSEQSAQAAGESVPEDVRSDVAGIVGQR